MSFSAAFQMEMLKRSELLLIRRWLITLKLPLKLGLIKLPWVWPLGSDYLRRVSVWVSFFWTLLFVWVLFCPPETHVCILKPTPRLRSININSFWWCGEENLSARLLSLHLTGWCFHGNTSSFVLNLSAIFMTTLSNIVWCSKKKGALVLVGIGNPPLSFWRPQSCSSSKLWEHWHHMVGRGITSPSSSVSTEILWNQKSDLL